VTELTFAPSGQYLVARTSQLGRFGCFVKTNPFSSGSTVSLRITYDLREFVAAGEVVYVLPDKVSHIAGPDQREARLRLHRSRTAGRRNLERKSQSVYSQTGNPHASSATRHYKAHLNHEITKQEGRIHPSCFPLSHSRGKPTWVA
jgi:hypothetical protein